MRIFPPNRVMSSSFESGEKTFFLLIPLRPLVVESVVCHQAAPGSQSLGLAAEATEGQYVYKSTVPEGTESPDRLGCPE